MDWFISAFGLWPRQDVRSEVHGQRFAETIEHKQTTWETKHTVIDSGLPPLAGQNPKRKKQQPGDEKRHARCRAAGFKFCDGCMLDNLRKRIKDAVRALCKATSILNEEAGEAQQKANIKKLMDGWWFLAFTGCPVATDDGEGQEALPVEPAVHYMHVSWVLGGLQQFFPVFGKMEIADAALEASEQISMKFSGQFIDFYQFCAQLNIDWTWSVQRFELQSRDSIVIGNFIAEEVSATRAQCPPAYMAWKGAAAYRRLRRHNPHVGAGDAALSALSALSAIMDDVDPMIIDSEGAMDKDNDKDDIDKDRASAASDSGGSQADDESVDFDIELWGGENGNQDKWIDGFLDIQEQEEEQQVVEMDSAVHPVEPGPEQPVEPGPEQPVEPGPEQPVEPEVPVEPEPPVEVERAPRSHHDSLQVFGPDGSLKGEIKYKPGSRDLFAKCFTHPNCFKTRTVNESARNPFQGRPLGFLSSWCCDASMYGDKSDHNKACVPSKASRVASRRRLTLETNYGFFAEKERKKYDYEASEPDEFS